MPAARFVKAMSAVVLFNGLLYFALDPTAALASNEDDAKKYATDLKKGKDAKNEKPAEKCDAAATKEEVSTTEHTVRIGGQNIAYKATASTTLLKNDKGDATGLLYSVAYTKSDVKDLSTRPISFLYNGGPGSATMPVRRKACFSLATRRSGFMCAAAGSGWA